MKVVIQRVTHASVTVEGKLVSSINQGLLVLAGWVGEDTPVRARLQRVRSLMAFVTPFPPIPNF